MNNRKLGHGIFYQFHETAEIRKFLRLLTNFWNSYLSIQIIALQYFELSIIRTRYFNYQYHLTSPKSLITIPNSTLMISPINAILSKSAIKASEELYWSKNRYCSNFSPRNFRSIDLFRLWDHRLRTRWDVKKTFVSSIYSVVWYTDIDILTSVFAKIQCDCFSCRHILLSLCKITSFPINQNSNKAVYYKAVYYYY